MQAFAIYRVGIASLDRSSNANERKKISSQNASQLPKSSLKSYHVTVLILLKGVLFARSSRLIPDKANLGFRFPCDGPGRGGTCQVSAWDHVFLGLFWMYNSISVVIFHFSWKMQSDVWGSISDQGVVTHITGGNFAQSSITINGWLRDFLWAQASQSVLRFFIICIWSLFPRCSFCMGF